MKTSNSREPDKKGRFVNCPKCNLKGLYQIKQRYSRCRYCGTYVIAPVSKKEEKDLIRRPQ